MTVNSARTLAVDWQIAPLTPVMTNGVDVAARFDDYGDTEADRGVISGQYINIPPSFPHVYNVSTYQQFADAIAIVLPGEAIVIADGMYDWSGDSTNIGLTVSGTLENPIFIMAATPLGVTFTAPGNKFKFTLNGNHYVMAGIAFDCNTTLTGESVAHIDVVDMTAGLRVHYCSFTGPDGIVFNTSAIKTTDTDHVEIENCLIDSKNTLEGGSGISIATALGNSFDHLIHHNRIQNANSDPIVNGGEVITMGHLGGPYNARYIIENNIFDDWNREDELISLKASMGLVRNNTQIHGDTEGMGTWGVRGGVNIIQYGNWADETPTGIGNQQDCYMAFNFFNSRDTSPRAPIRCGWSHADSPGTIGATFKNNVFSNWGRAIEIRNTSGAIDPPTGNLFDGNLLLDSRQQMDDIDPNINYYDLSGNWTEAQWRAGNTWGTNTYGAAALPHTYVVDPNLFDGPGNDWVGGVDYTIAHIYGQPSQIPMPSWWKLP